MSYILQFRPALRHEEYVRLTVGLYPFTPRKLRGLTEDTGQAPLNLIVGLLWRFGDGMQALVPTMLAALERSK